MKNFLHKTYDWIEEDKPTWLKGIIVIVLGYGGMVLVGFILKWFFIDWLGF